MVNFLFILHNIYESKNGVSNKYINFINFLKNRNYNVKLITTSTKDNSSSNNEIIYTRGIKLPFYESIKIPNVKENLILKIIKDDEYNIIFNGEFFWLYNLLIKIKNKNIKLFPTWHTDYEKYINKYLNDKFKIDFMLKSLHNNLSNNIFDGIIVTGEITKNKFSEFTNNIFNANELCIENFNHFKIDEYKNEINFLYCGRISKEKNINFSLNLLNNLKDIKFNFHLIGDGPYTEIIKKYINEKKYIYNIILHGELNHDKILELYKKLNNRIFIMTSDSETFGKAPLEAGLTGIPIFIKNNEITESIYSENNSYIFNDKFDFINNLICFLNSDYISRKNILDNSLDNIKKYDQKEIFKKWEYFFNNNPKSEILKKYKDSFYYFISLVKCSIDVIND